MLEAAAEIIRDGGVGALTTRGVAERSGVPVATVYRYFENSDAIIAAFLDRERENIDVKIAQAVLELDRVSLRSLTEATAVAHLRHLQEHPIAVLLWFDPHQSDRVRERVKLQNERLGDWLDAACRRARLVHTDTPAWGARMIIRLADRAFAFAFVEHDVAQDREDVIFNFVDMVVLLQERYGTPAGIEGIPTSEFVELLGEQPAYLEFDHDNQRSLIDRFHAV